MGAVGLVPIAAAAAVATPNTANAANATKTTGKTVMSPYVIKAPDVGCTGSLGTGWQKSTNGKTSIRFWYTFEASSLVCIGTVEGRQINPIPRISFRVNIYHNGTHSWGPAYANGTSPAIGVHSKFPELAQVCGAWVHSSNHTVEAGYNPYCSSV